MKIISLFLAMMPTMLWASTIYSPNKKVAVEYAAGADGIKLLSNGNAVLQIPKLGVATENDTLSITDMSCVSASKPVKVSYPMLIGKKSHCCNEYSEYVFTQGTDFRLVCRLYNDGLAFRYELDNLKDELITSELTTYYIKEGQRRWMQTFDVSYERFFPRSITGVDKARHWGYPALIEAGNNEWALITEAGIERNNSASSLYNPDNAEMFQVRPDTNKLKMSGSWQSPWRVIMIGSLNNIVESTLVTDVSPESRINDTSWIHPGVASWVYWAYNHGSKDFQIVKSYIDMAATMHLPYVLIDWEWDVMENGGTFEDALRYADSLGVKVLVWYNSSTAWTTNGAGGPLFRLNTAESREKEFAWLSSIGVAGVKIDFFEGDTQPTMAYCIDLLESAAKHHLLVNFHGATVPRGWQRTYPNLLSTEAVYGAEWYNNVPTFTDRAACHNATLSFTRNVIGPMDYTPCTFSDSQHPHITSKAHELALTVLFESGLQHLADKPESYLAQPKAIVDFLSHLPSTWDETHLLSGFPGESVVMARRKGGKWYIAGINGTDEAIKLSFPTSALKLGKRTVTTIADVDNQWSVNTKRCKLSSNVTIDCAPRGGFVIVAE